MRRVSACLCVAVTVLAPGRRALGQSAFAFCSDSVPNRIVSTGVVRAVVATIDSMRVCLAAEGFSDSAVLHPRDWTSPERLVVMETRVPGDTRVRQESRIISSWLKNDRPLANDPMALTWRAALIDFAAARWDVAARAMARRELEDGIAGLLAQKQWIVAQIDTIRLREKAIKIEMAETHSRLRDAQQKKINEAQRSLSIARTSAAQARRDLATATGSNDSERIQSAQSRLRSAEDREQSAAAALAQAQSLTPAAGLSASQDLLDRLDAKGRTTTLNAMLVDLDADARVATMRAALQSFESLPDPETRLRDAAARLQSILRR